MSTLSDRPRACPKCSTKVRPVQFALEEPGHCPKCGHVFVTT